MTQQEAQNSARPCPVLPQHEGPVIYVVDDDKSFRTALVRSLSAGGYATRPYACAEDLLLDVASLGEGCMILDVNLPGASGFGEVLLIAIRKALGQGEGPDESEGLDKSPGAD